jgi:Tfp pilus assembly protein PilF
MSTTQRVRHTRGAANRRAPASRETRPAGPRTASWRIWAFAVVVAVATVVCYLPSLRNGFTNWDDDLYVTRNPVIRELTPATLRRMATEPVAFNYHPLTVLSLALDYARSGLDPGPYHATNLLLHVLNSLLVFAFALRLSKGRAEAALLVGLLFALHPMHVESVAWVAERKDVLYTFFLMLALLAYLRYVERPDRRRGMFVASLACSALSLLAKPAAVAVPLLLLAIDYYERRSWTRWVLLEKLPFLALAVVFALVTLRIQSAFISVGGLEALRAPDKLLVASYGLVTYLVKALVPAHLSAVHPYPPFGNGWPAAYLAAPVIVAALVATVVWAHRRTRVVPFGAMFFVASLLPVLQIVSAGTAVVAERYTYVPYIGLFFILAMGYEALLARWTRRPSLPVPARVGGVSPAPRVVGLRVVAGGFVAVMAIVCVQRIAVWHDSGTLWSDVIAKYPSHGPAYISRGVYRMSVGDDAAALDDLDRSVELAPKNYLGPFNRGLLHQRIGAIDAAIADYGLAIQANPSKPDPYANRAGLLSGQHRHDEAIRDYDRVVEIEAGNPDALLNRAAAYYLAGRYEQALPDYDRALAIDPSRGDGHFFRAMALYRLGRFEPALESFGKAIALRPSQGEYYASRARCLAALGRGAEAAEDARRARTLGVTVDDRLIDPAH